MAASIYATKKFDKYSRVSTVPVDHGSKRAAESVDLEALLKGHTSRNWLYL